MDSLDPYFILTVLYILLTKLVRCAYQYKNYVVLYWLNYRVSCGSRRLWKTDNMKVSIHHFRNIGGCLDGHYFSSLVQVFISPRCLEPVGLTKNLAPNRIMSLWASNSFFYYLYFFKSLIIQYIFDHIVLWESSIFCFFKLFQYMITV